MLGTSVSTLWLDAKERKLKKIYLSDAHAESLADYLDMCLDEQMELLKDYIKDPNPDHKTINRTERSLNLVVSLETLINFLCEE